MAGDIKAMQQGMLASGDNSRALELGQYREEYLRAAEQFFNGDAEDVVLAELDAALSNPEISEEDFSFYTKLTETFGYLFSEARIILSDIQVYRQHLRSRLEGRDNCRGLHRDEHNGLQRQSLREKVHEHGNLRRSVQLPSPGIVSAGKSFMGEFDCQFYCRSSPSSFSLISARRTQRSIR